MSLLFKGPISCLKAPKQVEVRTPLLITPEELYHSCFHCKQSPQTKMQPHYTEMPTCTVRFVFARSPEAFAFA